MMSSTGPSTRCTSDSKTPEHTEPRQGFDPTVWGVRCSRWCLLGQAAELQKQLRAVLPSSRPSTPARGLSKPATFAGGVVLLQETVRMVHQEAVLV